MIADCRIDDYINLIRGRPYPVCEEQFQLCDLVEDVFATEDVYVDSEQLDKYMQFQRYFPFDLLPWEQFCFALHNCVYRKSDNQLRFPRLVIYVGRGSGKNGYLSFEDFALLTPVNGIKNYNIDIFAMSEKQAKMSFFDVYDMLEANKSVMKKHFYWTKEVIKNIKTGSELAFNTSSPKTKDGFRPGKVDFDEYHAYDSMKLVDVAVTGLGKKPHPRQTIITTDGDVRDGPLDTEIAKCKRILKRDIPDNGTLPFMCRIPDKTLINDKKNWTMANPSFIYFPHLQNEMNIEFADYKLDPIGHASFATRRCNCPLGIKEAAVTDWENIAKTNIVIPEFDAGTAAVGGIDYASTEDFVAAGLLVIKDNVDYWITHTWVCKESKDLPRIKAPLLEWEDAGLLTFVDGPEIPPETPAAWLENMQRHFNIIKVGIDKYRYTLLSKALTESGFSSGKDGNISLIRPSDEMMIIPTISSLFNNHQIAWGDSPIMRWYCNNAKRETSSSGNMTYGKIEPKSRKTDGFKAFVAAEILRDELISYNEISQDILQSVDTSMCWTY